MMRVGWALKILLRSITDGAAGSVQGRFAETSKNIVRSGVCLYSLATGAHLVFDEESCRHLLHDMISGKACSNGHPLLWKLEQIS